MVKFNSYEYILFNISLSEDGEDIVPVMALVVDTN
jgi:hypothetical protein